jgi:hypothetical protein
VRAAEPAAADGPAPAGALDEAADGAEAAIEDLGPALPLRASTRPEPLRFPGDEQLPVVAAPAPGGGGGDAGAAGGPLGAAGAVPAQGGGGGGESLGGVEGNGTIGAGSRLPRDGVPEHEVNGAAGGRAAVAALALAAAAAVLLG